MSHTKPVRPFVHRHKNSSSSHRQPRNKFAQHLIGLELLERRDLPAQVVLGSLLLDGPLVLDGTQYTASGDVNIGFNPTTGENFLPITVWNGNISFADGGDSFNFSGLIEGIEQSSNVSIASIGTTQSFAVSALTGSGVSISGGDSMSVQGADFTSNLIALTDPAGGDTTDSYVTLQGKIGFSQLFGLSVPVSGTNSVQLQPSVIAPGITLVAATSASAFQAFGANFSPVSLAIGYSSSANNFQISGSVGVTTSSGDFSLSGSLGTANSPGLLVSNSGSVTELTVSISSNITTYGLSINANGLTLNYDSAEVNQYSILSGTISASTSSGDFTFSGEFGFGSTPGVVLNNGSLTSLFATLNGSVVASGLTMTASNDVLQFNAATGTTPSEFQIISGDITVGSNTTSVMFDGSFGTASSPGVVLQNGQLTNLDITVTSNMAVSGLTMTANGVEFIYDSASDQFSIATGSVAVNGTGFNFVGVFGSGTGANATSGLTMTGSDLTGLDITVSSLINLDGMTLTVDNLEFMYEDNSNSIYNGDFLIYSGNVTIATTANDTFFEAQFGNAAESIPGLVIHNGSLSSLYTTITSTINAQNLILNANGLVFQYEGSTQTFEIVSGSVSVSSGDLQFGNATFGISGNPGLEIKNGDLTSLDITINSQMNVMGMSIDIRSMEFIYYAVNGQTFGNFEIAAGGSVSLSSGETNNPISFNGYFGTTQNGESQPGLVINNGQLQSFYIGITSNINAGGLAISTNNLTFSYVSSSKTFEIPNGSVSVVDSAGDFSFNGTFGSTLSNGTAVPGLVVSNGLLTELNTVVTSKLVAGGLTFELNNLSFYYNSTGNQYEIDSGNISFDTNEGFSFSAAFGLPNPSNTSQNLPGLVISNGVFTEFNATLNSSFTVAGLVIDVNDMTMVYNSSEFEMYGTVTVNTTDVSFTGTIGQPDASPPAYGLVIQNGDLESLAITINSNVTFSDLSMQAQNLSFNYQSTPESFTLYGNVSVSIDGVNLTGLLGNSTLPGLSLVNGQLNTLNLGVTTDFTLFGLNCDVEDLTFIYEASSSIYIMYGTLSVSIADDESTQKITATMGTESNPGLTITGSTVTEINMSLTADFTVDGFSFNVDDAGIQYQASDNTYQIYGTFTLTDVFSASVQLGTESNPGITVDNSVFIVNEIAISLDNVPIGAFTLNYVNISYDSAGDEWQGSAAVTFPTGWQIGASMTFINGDLDDISLFYSAGTSQGIAIPDTGIFVTYIEGSLQNLEDPVSIIVSGSIVGDFGGQISIGGTTCRIFTAMGSFSADSQQLTISGDYYLGAFQSNNSNPTEGWTGILGSGSATVDLNWAAGTYTADMNCSLYEGIFVISAEMAFNDQGDLGLIATATVEVPSEVPFIGGEKLGSMSFSFIYTASTNSGLVAAWTTINCGINITTGFEYNFSDNSSGDFELIGAGGVNAIENDFNSITSADSSVPTTYVYSYSVTVPSGSGSNGVSVQAIWPSNNGTQSLGITGPNNNGTYYFPTTAASTVPSNVEFLTNYTSATTQSVLYSGSPSNTTVLLPPGTYTFQLQSTYQFSSTSCVTWTNQLYYESPNIAVGNVPSNALAFVPNLSGYAAGALSSNTTVTLYIDTDNSGYNGKSSGTFAYSVANTTSGGSLLNVPSLDLSSYAPGVPVYIYAVINDGTNTAVTSAYSTAIVPVPNLVGKLVDQFNNPLSGIRMYLDLNNNQAYDAPQFASNGTQTSPGEPTVTTNSNGSYYFNNLESYASTEIGYPNFRVVALMPSPSFTPISPSNATIGFQLNDSSTSSNNTTESVVANFTINRLASITGSIYSDLLQTGIYNSTDPSLSGATVYLDTNGNTQYDAGELTCETGPSGTFGFYDLTPANYTMGIITSTTSGNSTIQNYLVTQPSCGTYTVPISSDSQQLINYSFGVISLATASGSVYSQPTSTSISSPLPGAIVQISTPNLTVSVPRYTTFSNETGLNLIHSTVNSSGSLVLSSSSQSNCATSSWFNQQVPVVQGFESQFQWSMTNNGSSTGGLTFSVQNSGTNLLGNSTYGYGGLTKSIGVIFNATNNQILVETGGNTNAASALTTISSAGLGFNIASGTTYTARITFMPTNAFGLGNLSVYLSGDSSGGMTPVLSTTVNLTSVLGLNGSNNAIVGFTSGATASGLSATISSWSFNSLNTLTTTTDSSGNYNFTGLMPLANYTITQVPQTGYVQASPLNTLGIYSQTSMSSLPAVGSSITTGDFNGDGIPDYCYATSLNSGISYQIMYAYGQGNGTFGAIQKVNLPVPASAPQLANPGYGTVSFDAFLAAGSFCSTSRDSICYSAVMANGGEVIVVYDIYKNAILNLLQIGTSTSTYAPTGLTPTQGYAGTINNIAVGDLNNDGYDDLAVSTYGGVYTLVSLQNIQNANTWSVNPAGLSNPLSTPALLYANGTSGNTNGVAYNAGVTIADYNLDGNMDLATIGVQYIPEVSEGKYGPVYSWSSMSIGTTLQLAYGIGTGVSFTPQNQVLFQMYTQTNIDQYFSATSSQPVFALPFGITSADVTGDGVADIALNGYMDNLDPGVFLIQQLNGTFITLSSVEIPNGSPFNINSTFGDNTTINGSTTLAAMLIAGDYNSDGYQDFAAIDPNNGQMMLLTTLSQPLVVTQSQLVIELAGGALPQFVSSDFNLDGYADFIIPGLNNITTQSAPVFILNGTINTGSISYTPTNGQTLTGQNFIDIDYDSSNSQTIAAASYSTPNSTNNLHSQAVSSSLVTLAGQVFVDKSQNGRLNAGETGLAGVEIYLDVNNNGHFDTALDEITITNSLGYYSFNDLERGHTYQVGFNNLPAGYSARNSTFSVPMTFSDETVIRSIGVTRLWYDLQSNVISATPLVPMVIYPTSLNLRNELGFVPEFQLIGNYPGGMSIDSYSGEVLWTPSYSASGTTISIQIQISDRNDHNSRLTQTIPIEIQVNQVSTASIYVRNVYAALLNRLPSTDEESLWTNKLQSGISRLGFVSAISKSEEALTILVNDTYLNILERPPTTNELNAGLNLLSSGGNSDQIVRQLLSGSEFSSKHKQDSDFVFAINQQLLILNPSRVALTRQIAWLKSGVSRASLVNLIAISNASTTGRANQLNQWYPGASTNSNSIVQWANALRTGQLSSDTLRIRILGSSGYATFTLNEPVPNILVDGSQAMTAYDRLSHLFTTLNGKIATRTKLDDLNKQLYQGLSWKSVATDLYDGQSAAVYRVQTQYMNLLHRYLSTSEAENVVKRLPSHNQVESLQIQILVSSEYRSQFSSNKSYVTGVYETLTGVDPTERLRLYWTTRLRLGFSASEFVASVAASQNGKSGQINRNYQEILGRPATGNEIRQWISQFGSSKVLDRGIAIQLLNSQEFQQKQQNVQLLPV